MQKKIEKYFRCVCNHLGTRNNSAICDKVTGQCPCYANVIGKECDECAPLHFNLASSEGILCLKMQ